MIILNSGVPPEPSHTLARIMQAATQALGRIGLVCIAATFLIGAADVSRFRAPSVHDGLIGVPGTDTLPPLHFNASAMAGWAYNPLVWRFEDGTYEPIIEHQFAMDLAFTMGIVRFIDVSVGLPVLLYQDGPAPPAANDPDPYLVNLGDVRGSALGDLRIVPRLQFADERTYGFGGAFESEITFHTGELVGGKQRFFGESGVSWRPRVVASTTTSFARFIGSVGVRIRNVDAIPQNLADIQFDHEWEYHLGSEIFILRDDLPLSALVEFAGANAIDFSGAGNVAMELLGGVRARVASDLVLTAAYGLGLTSGVGTPVSRILLGFSYAPRSTDQDNDGIPDSIDQCPYDPEDRDGFEDDDGCPEYDNDEDGIPDDVDRCPNNPEDFNGHQDEDGCPDEDTLDSDNDGIPDIHDRCPNTPEDLDGFKDDDGCPEYDNDIDGIPDDQDLCPTEKETINGIDDYDGCPDEGEGMTSLVETRIEIRESIHFESGKAIIKKQSMSILDQVALQILSHPEIIKVRIEGHTDDRGDEEDNLYLSQDRADAVRRYLISRGVDGNILEAVGFGESQPIDTNDTVAGRTKNRRVDFVIFQSESTPEQ